MPDYVHFWVGHFVSEDLFIEYLEEDEEGDETVPLNKFCRDQQELFIDHDCVETCMEEESDDITKVFYAGGYVDSFKDAVYEAARSRKLPGKMNAYISVYRADAVDKPRSVKGEGYWLSYLGKFPYKK